MNNIVQYLNSNKLMKINQEEFEILRKVSKNPKASQRELSSNLNISLGKINFVLNELKNKGLIKIQNFKQNPNKERYLYILTPDGNKTKNEAHNGFYEKKMQEYDELKKRIRINVDRSKIQKRILFFFKKK